MEFIANSVEQLDEIARLLLARFPELRVFALHGAMGAGKTTFISALCRQLGAGNAVCSPTYTIINEYVDQQGHPLYHFDFYRLKSAREALDVGANEYLTSGCYCFVEWPEIALGLLPETTLHVSLLAGETDNQRVIIAGSQPPDGFEALTGL